MIQNALIMITVLILPFAFVIAIEWMKSKERKKRYDLQAELYAKALEKGQPIPTDAFPKHESEKNNKLTAGVINIAAGIGLAVFFSFMSSSFTSMDNTTASIMKSVAAVGIIPFLVGIALVFIHFIEKKKNTGDNA